MSRSFVHFCYWVVSHYTNIPLFLYTFSYRWLSGILQALSMRNKAGINTCVPVFVWTCVFLSLGRIPERDGCASAKCLLSFKGNSQTSFQSCCAILQPHQESMSYSCSTSSLILGITSLFNFSHSDGDVVSSPSGVIFVWLVLANHFTRT